MKSSLSSLCALLTLAFLSLCRTSAEDDSQCLRTFKNSVGDPSRALGDWSFSNTSTGAICRFDGVTCWNSQENKVLGLKLSNLGLTGSFPSGLNRCASIQALDLSGNGFTGSIPSDICTQMPYLTTLDLSSNQFVGPIPEGLSNCTYLNSLKLSHNQLNGTIPYQIGLLLRLTVLDVSSNDLVGQIPSSLSNRTAIGKDALSSSSFDGNPGLCGPPLSDCTSSSRNVKLGLIIGAAIAGAAVALLGALIWWCLFSKHQKKIDAYRRDEHMWAKRIRAPKSIPVSMFEKPLVKLHLADLMAATDSFSKENIIFSGRTGTVYKATLPDGSLLAIKRLQASVQSEKQFKSEMNTLGQLRHQNLVPLLGYCVADGEKLLVYKHMVHGSLRQALHEVADVETRPDWTTRLKIAIGAARGLAWLHHSCNPRVIHRSITAASILLDDDYEARITDFGLARLMNPVDTHISTFVNGDFGDVGYVAPEYVRTLVATIKGDVYSFGVVLLELITGQKAMDVTGVSDFKGNLSEWILHLSTNKRVHEAIDASLKGKGSDDELLQFLQIACSCVLPAPKERPTMYEVYQFLRAIGEKYNLTDENDELPLCTESNDEDYVRNLIVATDK